MQASNLHLFPARVRARILARRAKQEAQIRARRQAHFAIESHDYFTKPYGNLWVMISFFMQPLFCILQTIEHNFGSGSGSGTGSGSGSDSGSDSDSHPVCRIVNPLIPFFETSKHLKHLFFLFSRMYVQPHGMCIPGNVIHLTGPLTAVPFQFRHQSSSMRHWLMGRLTTSVTMNHKQSSQMMNLMLRRVLSGAAMFVTDAGAFTKFLQRDFKGALQVFKMWMPLSEPSIFFQLMTGLMKMDVEKCFTLREIMRILPTLQYGQTEMLIALEILGTILKDAYCQMHRVVYSDFKFGSIPREEYVQIHNKLDTLQGLYTLVDGICERMLKNFPHLNDVNRVLNKVTCSHPSVLQSPV
jgi:hypothetical protein